MNPGFADRALDSILAAKLIARRMNHEFIGAEHLLLAVMKCRKGIGSKALGKLGVNFDHLRVAIKELVRRGPHPVPIGQFLPFTPRAKMAVRLAIKEAEELGHSAVGDEHLILGMLREGKCIAALALSAVGVDREVYRGAALGLRGADASAERPASAERTIEVISRTDPQLHPEYAPATEREAGNKDLRRRANEESLALSHEYIGVEHLLLAILKGESTVAVKALEHLGVDYDSALAEIEKAVPRGPPFVAFGLLPFTPRCKRIIDLAIEEARRSGHTFVDEEHFLLAMLVEGENRAALALHNLGVTLKAVRKELAALCGESQT